MQDQNMETKTTFDGTFAGSHSRTAARMFSSGLTNQFQRTTNDHAHWTISNAARAFWLKSSLMFLTAALWCLTLRGDTHTDGYEFVGSIPPPGSIQWDKNHRLYKEQQELHRKRMAIPDAVGTDVPIAAGAYLAFDRKIAMVPTPSPTGSFGMLLTLLCYAALFVLTGGLVLRRFASHVLVELNQKCNPWAVNLIAERNLLAKARAEEEIFARYLATFRIGPSVSSRVVLAEKRDPRSEFYSRTKKYLVAQRKLLYDIGREASDPVRHKMLTDLCFEMGELKGEAGVPGKFPVWQVASALEDLLKQLTVKMKNVSSSTLQAVSGGLDLLDDLCVPGLKPELLTGRPFKFLVVDDDLISRQAMSLSMKKAFSQPDLAMDGESALVQATRQAYDVIFLDVQMPGMDGFELCTKIRETVPNRNTPVVFVTSHNDLSACTQSTLSGGNDFMGKPFIIFEVTVKALTFALRGRLQQLNTLPCS
jgi:CheY-like chemotaxis protein